MTKIAPGMHVELAYKVMVTEPGESAPTVVAEFTAKQPDAFVFGADANMIHGFVAAVNGLDEGAPFDFVLKADDAFGPKNPDLLVELPRDTFVVDGEFDNENVYEGALVPMTTQQGMRVEGRVESITEQTVTLDFNHPLAGMDVHYQGTVLAVRQATAEELVPKQGCGGCGGNCGDGGCDCDGGCDGCK